MSVKRIRTEPHDHGAQGDERIRTAEQAPGADRVYDVRDWYENGGLVECVACPGCAFTFDAEHVTQATGQYDCPVCGASSRDGAAS